MILGSSPWRYMSARLSRRAQARASAGRSSSAISARAISLIAILRPSSRRRLTVSGEKSRRPASSSSGFCPRRISAGRSRRSWRSCSAAHRRRLASSSASSAMPAFGGARESPSTAARACSRGRAEARSCRMRLPKLSSCTRSATSNRFAGSARSADRDSSRRAGDRRSSSIREGLHRIAERRVVDEAAVPIVRVIDRRSMETAARGCRLPGCASARTRPDRSSPRRDRSRRASAWLDCGSGAASRFRRRPP